MSTQGDDEVITHCACNHEDTDRGRRDRQVEHNINTFSSLHFVHAWSSSEFYSRKCSPSNLALILCFKWLRNPQGSRSSDSDILFSSLGRAFSQPTEVWSWQLPASEGEKETSLLLHPIQRRSQKLHRSEVWFTGRKDNAILHFAPLQIACSTYGTAYYSQCDSEAEKWHSFNCHT